MAIELIILWNNGSSFGGSGDGSSSGSPAGEGSGDVPGGDLPSGDVPNNGEPSIPGEGGGNPPVPDSEVGGLPNTEPNLPNSGDNTTPPGATNQSGSVGGNGYGYGEGSADSSEPFVNSGVSRPRDVATPNSIYEQINPDGTVRSRAFYDENGRQFYRQDFDHRHFDKSTKQYYQPHEHHYYYNDEGQPIGKTDGPLSSGYTNMATE